MRVPILMALALAACLGGCDLVPVADMNGYCRINDDGELVVTVCNWGSKAAVESMTVVEFWVYDGAGWSPEPHFLATPALQPGACIELEFPIPAGCFTSDCEFAIHVDYNNQNGEENESNNTATGTCIG